MPKQSKVIPLLVFSLVVILLGLDGYDGINLSLSAELWGLLHYIIPIGFGGGLINKAINAYRDRNAKV